MNKENLQTTSVDKKYKKDIKYKENVQRGRLCNISDVTNIVVLICIIIRTKVLIHLHFSGERRKGPLTQPVRSPSLDWGSNTG